MRLGDHGLGGTGSSVSPTAALYLNRRSIVILLARRVLGNGYLRLLGQSERLLAPVNTSLINSDGK